MITIYNRLSNGVPFYIPIERRVIRKRVIFFIQEDFLSQPLAVLQFYQEGKFIMACARTGIITYGKNNFAYAKEDGSFNL